MSNKIFENRREAAILLCHELKNQIQKNDQSTVVIALPRGGVVLGEEIASFFNIRLDIVISKKIGAPQNPELAIGAVMHDGTFYPNQEIINILNVSQEYLVDQVNNKVEEVNQRLLKFRGNKKYDLKNQKVILVDDGIATGATMINAINWIKKQYPEMIIVAVPVAPKDTSELISQLVEKTIILAVPASFSAVGEFYHDFSEVSDERVINIMSKYKTMTDT